MNCDGLILHVRALRDEQLLDLASKDKAFILLDREIEGLEDRCVSFDHRYASQLATEFCIEKGHSKIACISGPDSRSSSQLRKQGFLDAMSNAGLTPTVSLAGEYDLPSGYQLTCEILQRNIPTAIYCCNEEMAVGALLAISERGLRVPDDISVICYDSGERADYVTPKLTSLHFPITSMAREATRKLVNPDMKLEMHPPKIIDRGSVRQI